MTSGPTGAPYQLVALDAPVSGHPQRKALWRDLGTFPDLTGALRARVDDVLEQLAANDGWLVEVEHLLIGPDPDGSVTVRSCLSSVGADPHSEHVPEPFEPGKVRDWLLASHGLTASTDAHG